MLMQAQGLVQHPSGESDAQKNANATRPQAGFLIVRNKPIPFENLPDSSAIPGISGIPLSDGVQRHLTASDDEVGGQKGREGKSNG
jgi:hypothetical protein